MSSLLSSTLNEVSQRQSQSLLPQGVEDFRKVLEDVGVVLSSNSEKLHHLKQEQALVTRELNKHFQNSDTECIGRFISGLKFICKKEKHFKKFLIPTNFQKSIGSDVLIYQQSLFSIFLRVDAIQDELLKLLLEHITVAVDESTDSSWLRTLLNPLTGLPTIKNGEKLAKELLDILEIATLPCQLEILESIPDIIPDNQCDFVSKHLTRLLDNNEVLCGAIVNCLTALNLDADIQAQIHEKILARIFAGGSLRLYLILLKFLISDFKSQNIVLTLLKIRNSLDNMVGVSNSEKESDKTMILHYLQTSALTQKAVAEGWLNTISNCKTSAEHKPIDLLIIVMLYHISEVRKRVIVAIFRKRVSQGLFKINLLEKAFERHMTQQFLKDYMTDLIGIGCYLLRFSKDATVAKFGTVLFETLFNHKYTPAIYRGEILSNLISLTGASDHYTINSVLKLILSLVETNRAKVVTHIPILMLLLENLDTLDFKDVKIVFDILCSLVCGEKADDSLSGFRDQIYNTIRKHLSRSERSIKHRGIISAVVMVKHTASVDDEQPDVSVLENSLLPRGPLREASEMLELVVCATGDNPDLMGLYYDQLASILASNQPFEKHFLYWLYKKVEDDFQAIFLTDKLPESINNMDFSVQYVLNRPEETKEDFAVNIAGFTVCDKNDKILLLAPYFRALRLLHFRQHQNLSEIDSLLGCGVILPEVNDPRDLHPDQIREVCDCLLHCANWFREIINAFVTQKDKSVQEKVVQRLGNLIAIEDKLNLFFSEVPSHNLPLSYFCSTQNVSRQVAGKTDSKSVGKNPKKRMKSHSVVINDTFNTTLNSQEATKISSSSKKCSLLESCTIQFREMDTDVIRLIKYPVCLTQETNPSGPKLNLKQVKFILNDFILKLSKFTQNKKDKGLSPLSDINPEYLIRDCVHIVRYMNNFLNVIVSKLSKILEEPEETRYTDDVNEIKACFGNIIQAYCLIFQWPGFQHTENVDLLREILKSTRETGSQSLISAHRLISDFVLKLTQYNSHCLHMSHAVSLLKTIETLHSLTIPTAEMKKKLALLAEGFLSKRWYAFSGKLDHGQQCNRNIDVIVKAYLKEVNVERLTELVESLVEDITYLEAKDGFLSLFPAINNKNFHVFYLGLCNALQNDVKSEIQALTNLGHLSLWLTVASTLTHLMNIAKSVKSRINLSCFLKKTIGILKIFLKDGIPMMEILMKNNSTEVCKVFKTIQTTTRFLHHFCCQSKLTRDSSIMAHIPSFKQTLESLIYRVKATLVANNCSSGFWLGNLRNKDIDGQDILSQSTVVSSNSSQIEANEEQLPSDNEDDNDDNIINNSASDNETVESDVY